MQGVPSFQTVHWTVWKFTLCGAPKGCIDLRSIWDSVPNPARGAASGLCQRDIVPLETRCCRLRRFGALPQTLPEALPLDSAKGTSSLWKPGVVGCADMGLCPIPGVYCSADVFDFLTAFTIFPTTNSSRTQKYLTARYKTNPAIVETMKIIRFFC